MKPGTARLLSSSPPTMKHSPKKNSTRDQTAGEMLRKLRPSASKAGLPPETPFHVGDQVDQAVTLSVTDYNAEGYSFSLLSPEQAIDGTAFHHRPAVTWLNICGLHQVGIIEKICDAFRIHPLVLEDILNTTQRPKVDVFDDYIFIVIKMHSIEAQENLTRLDLEQISFLLGTNFLITFQEQHNTIFDPVCKRLADNKGRIRKMGADYLTYALIDAIIDNFFKTLEQIGEEIEALEEVLISNPAPESLHKIHLLKRKMLLLRKAVWPLREVINSLQRDDLTVISPSIAIYLKDLYDHTIHIIDTVETFRDVIAGMLDIYLSSLSIRLNEIMKVLTIFTAVFIPLTLIAGIYGMNFNTEKSPWNMPELSWYWGYPFALGLMCAVGTSMVAYFKKRKWL